jgi:hypothetical protein
MSRLRIGDSRVQSGEQVKCQGQKDEEEQSNLLEHVGLLGLRPEGVVKVETRRVQRGFAQ